MSMALLGMILAALAVLTLAAPLHLLLAFDLLVIALPPGNWYVGGVLFDVHDLTLAAIVAGIAIRRRSLGLASRRVPYLGLWIALGVLLSLSYLTSPVNAEHLTDPVRVVYQLYRYAWKPILFYVLVSFFATDPRAARSLFFALLGLGLLLALQAIPQGYAGLRAGGPFKDGNGLGGALAPTVIVCVTMLALPGSPKRRLLLGGALLLLIRALLFSGSRGAIAATLVGCGVAGMLLAAVPRTRRAALRVFAPVAVVGLCLLLALPGLLERPNVRRALSLAEGSRASTFQWRVENRWPHFLNRAIEHPVLGVGYVADPTLGTLGNTPHNGYLAVAVSRGFPALAIYLIFAVIGIRNGLRLAFSRQPNPWGPAVGAACAAIIASVLMHNLVESRFEIAISAKVFWLSVALTTVATRSMARARAQARRRRPPAVRELTPVHRPPSRPVGERPA